MTTTLQPRQVVDRLGTIWPGEVTTDAGDLSFRGEYVTRGKAMVRVSLEGGIQTVRDGREVQITLRASPDQTGCIAFPIAAALLPVLALLVEALEPHQVLIWWAAVVGLFAGAQWVAGGLVIWRLARKILGVLDVG